MTVRLRAAGAVRQTHTPAEEGQAWGWMAQAGSPVVVLAEAGEFAFDLPRFNGLSAELIDALLTPERAAAWSAAAARVRARRQALGGDWDVSVYASAIRLQATGGEVNLSWLGAAQAILLRAGQVFDRTTPHTLGEERRRRGLLPGPEGDRAKFILMRCLSPEEQPAPDEVTWSVRPGDRIVLMSSLLADARRDPRVLHAGLLPNQIDAAADLLGVGDAGDPPVGLAAVVVDVAGDGA